jgi:hypothetical protein
MVSSRSWNADRKPHGVVRAGLEPAGRGLRLCRITGPPRPATGRGSSHVASKPARIRTRTVEVGARCAPVTPRACESGRPGSNGPPRSGAPVLCRLSYVRVCVASWGNLPVPPDPFHWSGSAGQTASRSDSNQRPPPSQDGALSAELTGVRLSLRLSQLWPASRRPTPPAGSQPNVLRESLRQDSNPHPGRTKGVCLPLTLRRQCAAGGDDPPTAVQLMEKPSGCFSGFSGPSPWPKSDARVRADPSPSRP